MPVFSKYYQSIRTVDFSRSKLYINHNTTSTSYQVNNWSSIMDWQFNYGFSVWRIACLIYIQGFSMPQEGLVIYIIEKNQSTTGAAQHTNDMIKI